MRILLATSHLGLGGSESYLLTVAEQLDRLGHEAVVFATESGPGAPVAAERGVRVVGEATLSDGFDAAVVQDAAVSHQLALRLPSLPQLFVAHSEIFDLQLPPQLDGAVAIAVALNDRVAERLGGLAVAPEVVRLRQPIDTERFTSRNPLPEKPRRALLLSNTPVADRLKMLEEACEANGIELRRLGGVAGQTRDPRTALVDADIVIGYGRSILEAMSCGRAAYVYDWQGGDGWVTPESYPAIEAGGAGGRNGDTIVDRARLIEDLGAYSPAMGPVNHDLVIAHHRANVHAQELVGLLRRLGCAASRPREGLDEMARLVRLEWRARAEVHALSAENVRLRDELLAAHERAAEQARAVEADVRRSYERTLSWRITAPLRRLYQGLSATRS